MEPLHGFDKKSHVVLDVLGPTVEFLVLPSECAGGYCVIRGTIPQGVSVPIHSHPDDESFFLFSGFVQAREQHEDKFEWINMEAGDFRHVPQGVKRAWKNQSNDPAMQSRNDFETRQIFSGSRLTHFQGLHLRGMFGVSPR
jgi:quercetin dioxygenase-like cupin family protein